MPNSIQHIYPDRLNSLQDYECRSLYFLLPRRLYTGGHCQKQPTNQPTKQTNNQTNKQPKTGSLVLSEITIIFANRWRKQNTRNKTKSKKQPISQPTNQTKKPIQPKQIKQITAKKPPKTNKKPPTTTTKIQNKKPQPKQNKQKQEPPPPPIPHPPFPHFETICLSNTDWFVSPFWPWFVAIFVNWM